MCPIIYFLALAFADSIFHPRLIQAGLSVDRLHKFACPTGRTTIDFSFREDILDATIFRPSAQVLSGKDGVTIRALTVTHSRITQPQLLQILGHRNIETYINHHQSTNVVVDVQSTFLGTESKSDMIKEISRLFQRLDPKLPRCLKKEQQRAACKQPKFREKLRELELLRSRLKRNLEGRYSTLTS
ncbi:MAG: hypothetical protein Q9212_001839 [Teloschistes hypoglaucus]